jgi:hypothetical protein
MLQWQERQRQGRSIILQDGKKEDSMPIESNGPKNLASSNANFTVESSVIVAVRRSYRIYRYLMVVAAMWVIVGGIGIILSIGFGNEPLKMLFFTVQSIGFGLLTAAAAVKLAVFRCPVCDQKIDEKSWMAKSCISCGEKIR